MRYLHDNPPDQRYRNELKYVCSEGELQIIQGRIRNLCRPDSHVGPTGIYNIRSIILTIWMTVVFMRMKMERIPEKNTGFGFITLLTAGLRWSVSEKSGR